MSPKLLLILVFTLAFQNDANVYWAKMLGVNVVLFSFFETPLTSSSAVMLLKLTGKLAKTFHTSVL